MVRTVTHKPHGTSLGSLKDRVRRNPRDGAAWLSLALALARYEPGSELRHAITKSIELLPDDYQAWLLAGLDIQHRQGSAAAQQWLQHIAQQRPTLAAPRLAAVQLLTGTQVEKANQGFHSVIQAFPDDARAHLLFAEHLQNQGKLHQSADQLEQALAIAPDVAENWAALATLRLAEDCYGAVIVAASKALELDATADGPRLNRAEAYRHAARWDLAIADYRQAGLSMPDSPFILLGLGACLAGQGEYDEALRLLKKASRIKPDLVEVQLNIALVLASQCKHKEALEYLQPLLAQTGLPTKFRDTAVITCAILKENLRLESIILRAIESGEVSDLQQALLQAPEILMQNDSRSVEQLWAMALACKDGACRHFVTTKWPIDGPLLNPVHLSFAEACLSCRAAYSAVEMVTLWHAIQQAQTDTAVLNDQQRDVLRAWRSMRERGDLPVSVAGNSREEAHLRYWHFRLLNGVTASQPGLFKFSPNSIGLHQTTAPQHLITRIQILMNEVSPSVPAGVARAVFMLAAINQIHAFVDGNGRLARFVMNFELEQSGMQAVLFLPEIRKKLGDCLHLAQIQHDFEPLLQIVQQALVSTQNLLEQFEELLNSEVS